MEERLTKNQLKEKRKLENLRKMEEVNRKSGSKMKLITIAIACILFLAFSAFLILASKSKPHPKAQLSNSGWMTGNTSSNITVTEFGDFQCPACAAFEPTMQQLRDEYGDKVRIEFMHFPLTQAHPNAMEAAIAAESAGNQGKFWEYHDVLYENQDEWASMSDPSETFLEYAKSLKLDLDQFKKDIGSKEVKEKINNQANEGIKIGVNSTPTILINGEFEENRSYSGLKSVIDKLLSNSK